jgi:hypothetical protein
MRDRRIPLRTVRRAALRHHAPDLPPRLRAGGGMQSGVRGRVWSVILQSAPESQPATGSAWRLLQNDRVIRTLICSCMLERAARSLLSTLTMHELSLVRMRGPTRSGPGFLYTLCAEAAPAAPPHRTLAPTKNLLSACTPSCVSRRWLGGEQILRSRRVQRRESGDARSLRPGTHVGQMSWREERVRRLLDVANGARHGFAPAPTRAGREIPGRHHPPHTRHQGGRNRGRR